MILRNMTGRPWRAALTIVGIALAVPMVVLGCSGATPSRT